MRGSDRKSYSESGVTPKRPKERSEASADTLSSGSDSISEFGMFILITKYFIHLVSFVLVILCNKF